MYYTIYKITNKINGKIYIGQHKTKKLDDGYMGSGKHLARAKEKHGIENFEKEILFVFDNFKEMDEKEKEIVTLEFCLKEDNYNLCEGGYGDGFSYINRNTEFRISKNKKAKAQMDVAIHEKYGVTNISQLDENRKKAGLRMTERNLSGLTKFDNFKGRNHTDETKEKISNTQKARLQILENNSQYGTIWIYSLEMKKSKKISKDDVIPEGWLKGRKIKFE